MGHSEYQLSLHQENQIYHTHSNIEETIRIFGIFFFNLAISNIIEILGIMFFLYLDLAHPENTRMGLRQSSTLAMTMAALGYLHA